ncbi:MAG: hypothetical protein KBT87_08130 [Gammaproteobacteria bacterium]|nr:hypothetical protein [Gammaproteobacteria bacterium]MBQ0774622.1 hypothetical protein [Gammaproteobacteria bacterium]
MKAHIINRFIAITAVAWLGQAGAETNTYQRHSNLNSSTSSPAGALPAVLPHRQAVVAQTNDHRLGVITLHSKNRRT